jgi:hypothetical protein
MMQQPRFRLGIAILALVLGQSNVGGFLAERRSASITRSRKLIQQQQPMLQYSIVVLKASQTRAHFYYHVRIQVIMFRDVSSQIELDHGAFAGGHCLCEAVGGVGHRINAQKRPFEGCYNSII